VQRAAERVSNWGWFVAAAELERATRIVWLRLSALGIVPRHDIAGQQLEHLGRIGGFHAEHLRERLAETVAALRHAGIDVVLLKGAALAHSAYDSFLERPMSDLDLLVPPESATRAHEVAQTVGWNWDRTTFPLSRYEGHHHRPPLDDAAGTGVRLELHTGIALDGHPFAISFDTLKTHGRRTLLGDADAIIPCAEHLMLHEAVHFAWSHVLSFGAWRTARDVRVLSAGGMLDWDAFARHAREHRADSCAYWTLTLARFLGGADIPDEILQAMRPRLSSLTHHVLKRHFVYHLLPIEEDWPSERLRRTMWEKAIQPERYGHGHMRPWELDTRGPETVPEGSAAAASQRPSDALGRLGVWARYVRALS
jgi:hypothetical protein